MSQTPYYVGVDVGGQTIKGGVVDDSGHALSSVAVPTEAHKGQEHGLGQMCETVRRAVSAAKLKLDDVSAIGVATPGTMDIPAGVILDPPNLKPWQNVPVRQHVFDTFKKPTAFQNDANAAAYGEYWAGVGKNFFGPGKPANSLVLFTLGTGIGCGIIVNDFIVQGEHSHGAETGHIIIEMTNPRQCGCGGWGHLEAYASAISIAKRTNEALERHAGPTRLREHLQKKGGFKEEDAGLVFDAAAAGDPLADRLIEETAYYLAVGAVNMMHTIDPDLIVFGGGMIKAGQPFLDRIRMHIKRMAFPVPAAKTQVVYATLGNDAGFVGAAACGRQLWLRSK